MVNTMQRRRVNVANLRETKWQRDKTKELIDDYNMQERTMPKVVKES